MIFLQLKQVLMTPLKEVPGLWEASFRRLVRDGFRDVGQVLATGSDLLRIPAFGRGSLKNLNQGLRELGVPFGSVKFPSLERYSSRPREPLFTVSLAPEDIEVTASLNTDLIAKQKLPSPLETEWLTAVLPADVVSRLSPNFGAVAMADPKFKKGFEMLVRDYAARQGFDL